MHIAMMTAWNTDSGVAVHAEPLVKAWREMGWEVTVFSHTKDDFHGVGYTACPKGIPDPVDLVLKFTCDHVRFSLSDCGFFGHCTCRWLRFSVSAGDVGTLFFRIQFRFRFLLWFQLN